jgi:hypothetical protein
MKRVSSMTEKTEITQTVAERNYAFAQSLRNAAAFIEKHAAELPDSAYCNTPISMYAHEVGRVTSSVQAMSPCEKTYFDTWASLHRQFGNGVSLRVTFGRDLVCQRKQVGTEIIPATEEYERPIYEYDCSPILGLNKEV